MEWPGIQRDLAPTSQTAESSDGFFYAQNLGLWTRGECNRRTGFVQATPLGAYSIANTWDPINGNQIILFTSAGKLELVAL